MVDREITEGRRIGTLLESEIDGHRSPPFDEMTVTNRDPDADPSGPGGRLFDVEYAGETLATVFVQPDRIFLSFSVALDAAESAATERGLRVRPKATTPPGLLVFVENGAAVKRGLDVLAVAADAAEMDRD